MDAVEYNMALYRMCQSNDFSCNMCEFNKLCGIKNSGSTLEDAKKAVEFVKQWAKDHPFKTRQSEFLKMFPKANLKNITRLLPCSIDSSMNPLRCAKYGYLSSTCRCGKCRYDYWNEEVTDND